MQLLLKIGVQYLRFNLTLTPIYLNITEYKNVRSFNKQEGKSDIDYMWTDFGYDIAWEQNDLEDLYLSDDSNYAFEAPSDEGFDDWEDQEEL